MDFCASCLEKFLALGHVLLALCQEGGAQAEGF